MALTQISTAGVKDDAVTSGKIPANAVGSSELADNAVDTAAIADQAVTLAKLPHGTSSNNGKFLRANNGADPSFETVNTTTNLGINFYSDSATVTSSTGTNVSITEASSSQAGLMSTTHHDKLDGIASGATYSNINGNVDNRVLTATGTTGVSQGEEKLTWNGNNLHVERTVTAYKQPLINIYNSGAYGWGGAIRFSANWANTEEHQATIRTYGGSSSTSGSLAFEVGAENSEKLRILPTGGITFNGDTAAANALDDYEEGTCTPEFQPASGSYGYIYRTGHYTRIGDVVHLTASISINGATNASGEVKIQGLPFSVRPVNSTWSGEGGHGVGRWFYAGPNHYCFLVCDNSDDKIRVHKADGTFLNHTNMSTGYNQSQFSFTVTYLTDG